MDQVAPSGPIYQAGTLSGNPIGMAAGIAQLSVLWSEDPYDALASRTAELVAGVLEAASERGLPACGGHVGSMWGIYFTAGPVTDYATAKLTDTAFFAAYHRACLDRGIFFAPSAFEAGFLSTAHGADEIDRTLNVVGEAMDAVAAG